MNANDFKIMAEQDPQQLSLLVERGIGELSRNEWHALCEIAGQYLPTPKIQGPLVRQLHQARSKLDYDAVLSGLSYHMDETTLAVLHNLMNKSNNPTIRGCIEQTLHQLQCIQEITDDDNSSEFTQDN